MTWLMDASFAPWLRYDKEANRMFCRFCEKFERSERNQVSETLDALVQRSILIKVHREVICTADEYVEDADSPNQHKYVIRTHG